jgi:hypothetical protein
MEPRYHSTVSGDLVTRSSLLQFIRAFIYSSNIQNGYLLEFGVLNGQSIIEFNSLLRGKLTSIYGFDSFEGLPQLSSEDEASLAQMPIFHQGNFKSNSIEQVRQTILSSTGGLADSMLKLVAGFYETSLPAFDKAEFSTKGPCLLIHVDCDLYSSSQQVFNFINDIAETGTWLLLDDYWCYKGSPKYGQRKAFEEWINTSQRLGATEYCSYNGFSRAYILHEK